MIIVILVGLLTLYLKRKYLYQRASKYILFICLMSSLLVLEIGQYASYISSVHKLSQITVAGGREVIFKNINPSDYTEGVKLLEKTQDYYKNLGGENVDSYIIEGRFLSSVHWKFLEQSDNYVLEKNCLRVNIYSLASLNFYEPSIVSKICDDMICIWKSSIPHYDHGNRYFRHILDGSGEVFKMKAIDATFGGTSSVSGFAVQELDSIFGSPITKNNYIKRVGMLVASTYEKQLPTLVKVLDESKIKTDTEFVKMLKYKFPDIYQDPYIHDFLKTC